MVVFSIRDSNNHVRRCWLNFLTSVDAFTFDSFEKEVISALISYNGKFEHSSEIIQFNSEDDYFNFVLKWS